jgi:hypothetical protein
MTADIKGSKTTDLGTVTLESSLGVLDLSSSPDGLEYAVRASDDPGGKPVPLREDPRHDRRPPARRLRRHLLAPGVPRPRREVRG